MRFNINKRKLIQAICALLLMLVGTGMDSRPFNRSDEDPYQEDMIRQLLDQMTLEEKIGQLMQRNGDHPQLDDLIRRGLTGSVLNEPDPREVYRLQQLAVEESRLGIPLLIARDVIHGFRTIMPIPLGQAASWNPELVEQGARVAALEASSQGIRWSFAPMIDVTRDPRWGRIAESFGEDHLMNGVMGAAVVRGFQGEDLSEPTSVAACVKHFAAYGWAEGGRDYNTASIPRNELHDIILPPFKRAIEAGAQSIMTAFNEINGIPATGHEYLLKEVLRDQWGFQGVILSDWQSLTQMVVHGYTPNDREAAFRAMAATMDMEMASTAYEQYLPLLIEEGRLDLQQIDEAVLRILRLKADLGLFDAPYAHMGEFPELLDDNHLQVAKQLAAESAVLLKNNGMLPIDRQAKQIAVIGPLADAPHDQLGTWIFDGGKEDAITPLQAIREYASDQGITVHYHRALALSRSDSIMDSEAILRDVQQSDLVLLFLGEESILSGESHSRANIDLPGAQEQLVRMISQAGVPVAAIIMAGRPLTFERVEPLMDAILYAWHPGTMAGPALSDLLFGKLSPSGKLPVTFPRHVGQIPIYYNHKNTGKPASDATWERMEDIPAEAPQLSIGNTSHYLDYGFEPMYPFGFGLSYSTFEIEDIQLNSTRLNPRDDTLQVSMTLRNTGTYDAAEVVQLYTRQLYGSRTRPLRELRAFRKISVPQGETRQVTLTLSTRQLGFHNPDMEYVVEPGVYHLWVATDSGNGQRLEFEITN